MSLSSEADPYPWGTTNPTAIASTMAMAVARSLAVASSTASACAFPTRLSVPAAARNRYTPGTRATTAAKPAPAKGMCREWHTGVSRPPATRQASREEAGAFQCHHVSATQCAACASPPARNAQPKVLIGMEKYTG